jgi:Bacterial protein of unknown function (DUF899)
MAHPPRESIGRAVNPEATKGRSPCAGSGPEPFRKLCREKLLAKEKAVTRARHVPCAVSRAPLRNTLRYQKRMGWTVPWFSSAPSAFNVDFGVARQKGETFGLSVFLRDGRRVAPISPRSAAWRR